MSLPQGRVIKCPDSATTAPTIDLDLTEPNFLPVARVVPQALVDASQQAKQRMQKAELTARQIVEDALRERETLLEDARKLAHLEAEQRLAQAWICFHARQAKADQEALQRNVELARILAERILREQLRLHPDTIQAIAVSALKTLGRARQIRVLASPKSADQLRTCLSELQSRYNVLEIREEPNRPDSDLKFECDMGSLDASIGQQLDRLAIALHEILAKEE